MPNNATSSTFKGDPKHLMKEFQRCIICKNFGSPNDLPNVKSKTELHMMRIRELRLIQFQQINLFYFCLVSSITIYLFY
jgi:hypothetical protein